MSSSANNSHAYPAPFFVIEGVDGSGKSTQVQLLAAWLRELQVAVIMTREPGGTALAERLRELILDSTISCAPRAELLMLLAARAQHVAEIIAPSLMNGITVVSDRFTFSSLAYQGYGRGLPLDEITEADAVATGGIRPALTVLLDVPLSVALNRIGERQDRFEGEGRQFLQRVIDGYRELAVDNPSVCTVDGTRSEEDVQEAIRRAIRPFIAGDLPAGG